MRIAFDHQIFGWQKHGGISRYAYELARHLSAMPGHEVAIVAPFQINDYLRPGEGLKVLGRAAPHFPQCGRIYRALGALPSRVLLARLRPDIVHETYYSRFRQAPASARVVVTVHDLIHEKFPEELSAFNPIRREKAAAIRRADHIICNSENTRRDLLEMFRIAPSAVSVVHHGGALLRGDGNAHAETYDPFLLYVGLRGGYKNFRRLVEAYAASARLRAAFRLICFGGPPFSTAERAGFRGLGLADAQVIRLDGNDRVLAGLYRKAALFVMPSRYEGFGLPVLEAMALGCPVACSGTSSLPEVAGDAAEMFDPDSVDSIRHCLEALTSDTGLRAERIRRGYERAAQFSWRTCAEQTLRVYSRLTS